MGKLMLNRFFIFLLAMTFGTAPGFAAGTVPGISMTQQLDSQGRPLNGGKLYLIQAGTTSTPQNCYQDSGLTIAWPNPITLDAAGRVPQLFCADGSIKIRLTNSVGVPQLVADNLLVVGPSGGGGGGGSVDATTILATGDFKMVYGSGPITGFVRCNGRTIGSASSGATERANADTQALFEYLWGVNSNLSVSGGRGASAAADWAANKNIALPDCRGRVLASDDSSGNSPAGRLTDALAGIDSFGDGGGSQTRTLLTANLPPYTPGVSLSGGQIQFGWASNGANWSAGSSQTVTAITNVGTGSTLTISGGSAGFTLPTVNIVPQGGTSTAFSIVQPTLVITTYIKL